MSKFMFYLIFKSFYIFKDFPQINKQVESNFPPRRPIFTALSKSPNRPSNRPSNEQAGRFSRPGPKAPRLRRSPGQRPARPKAGALRASLSLVRAPK